MAKRHKKWARAKRLALVEALGGVCQGCGTTEALTFDCIEPEGDAHHRYDTSQRMSFYTAQARRGNLQLLCSECNALKGDLSRLLWDAMIQTLIDIEARRALSCSPGEGTRLSPLERREHLRRLAGLHA